MNEILDVSKRFSLEDNKRSWVGEFDPKRLQLSTPLYLVNGENDAMIKKKQEALDKRGICIDWSSLPDDQDYREVVQQAYHEL